jgi:hypothetical protein
MPKVWYDYEYKKWVSITEFRKNHKGYSSEKKCMTIRSAIRSARSMFELGDGKISVTRVYRKHGKRMFRDWYYNADLDV